MVCVRTGSYQYRWINTQVDQYTGGSIQVDQYRWINTRVDQYRWINTGGSIHRWINTQTYLWDQSHWRTNQRADHRVYEASDYHQTQTQQLQLSLVSLVGFHTTVVLVRESLSGYH